MVKNFLKKGSFKEAVVDEVYGKKEETPFDIITKKPITASADEIKKNTRARSAKLRIAEKK